MPIGKEETYRQTLTESETIYRQHCQLIDKKLKEGAGQGLSSVPVTIPEKECPDPVVNMIRQGYQDAGWTVEVDRDQREQSVIFRFS